MEKKVKRGLNLDNPTIIYTNHYVCQNYYNKVTLMAKENEC